MSLDVRERFELRLKRLKDDRDAITGLLARQPRGSSPDRLDLPGLAWLLEAAFSEMEEVLKGIAQHFGEELPASPSSHRDLLDQMSSAAGRRAAVLSASLKLDLDPYLAFRHFSRYATFPALDWAKLSVLLAGLDDVIVRFEAEVSGFLARHGL